MQPEKWLHHILSVVRTVSDATYQERVWIRGEGPECDSLTETYCNFFDDYDIDGFLSHCTKNELISPQQLTALREVRDAMDAFEFDSDQPDEVTLRDLRWEHIRKVAQSALAAFEN